MRSKLENEAETVSEITKQKKVPESLDGIIVPPGCDNPLLRNSGEKVHTYTPSSYVPYTPKPIYQEGHAHMMSGKTGGVSVPRNPTPSSQKSMSDYLQQFQGAYLCLDLWSASRQKLKRCGVLLEIGKDFLVMGDSGGGKISIIDLKPIHYINIYCK